MRATRVPPIPRAPRPRRFRRLFLLPVRYWQWTLWIAIGLLGLAGVAVLVLPRHPLGPSRIKDTEIGVQAVRGATTMYLAEHRKSHCPNVQALIAGGFLDEDKSTRDHWGGEFRIECAGTRITVTSAGPDQTFGTVDDID